MKRLYPLIILSVVVGVAALGYSLGRLTAPPLRSGQVWETGPDSSRPTLPSVPETEPASVAGGEEDRLLVVETPASEAAASGNLEVTGRAKGGATVRAELTGEDGVIWSDEASLPASDAFVSFSLTATLPSDLLGPHLLTVTRSPAAEGEKEEIVTRDVVFGIPDAIKVKIYFPSAADAGGTDCASVSSVERLVSGQASVYRATVEQLLVGPTADEKGAGFTTSIPKNVQLKAVAADAAGIVTADFSSSLDRNVAGSCRVTSIRSQITRTLEQFPEVRGVIIAVDGRVEDALQP